MAGSTVRPAELSLDGLAGVEEVQWIERSPDTRRGVQEVGLIEYLAYGFRYIERRDGLDFDPVLDQELERSRDVLGPVADVRAKAEVSVPRGQSCSSSSGPESGRSTMTSTATSEIASGNGGSGFDARTRTLSEPYRSISRSPITCARRSRVR